MENCTAEYLSDNDYGGKYSCGPDGKQTEVRVIERDSREQVLWSYVVRPQSIMCKAYHYHLSSVLIAYLAPTVYLDPNLSHPSS